MIAPDAVVTFERPEGFRIIRSCGAVSGSAVMPRNVLRATVRTLGAFMGFAPVEYQSDAERARSQALAALLGEAARTGANGVVRVRFEASESGDGSTRVVASGDAVVLEPQP